MYLEKDFGMYFSKSGISCVFPPAHFIIGRQAITSGACPSAEALCAITVSGDHFARLKALQSRQI
jgi:hypothetical protein